MKSLRTLILFVFFGAVCARSEGDSARSVQGVRLAVAGKTMILPAWGSAGLGNTPVTVIQASADALAALLIVSDLSTPRSSPGRGLGAALGVLALLFNRLVSLPLNEALVSWKYPGLAEEGVLPASRADAGPRDHFALAWNLGWYDSPTSLGLSLETRRARLGLAGSLGENDFGYFDHTGPGGAESQHELVRQGAVDVELEGKIHLFKGFQANPGCRALVRFYHRSQRTTLVAGENGPTGDFDETPTAAEIIPQLGLSYRPSFPASVEFALGYAVVQPALERRFYEAMSAAGGGDQSPGPLRAQLSVKIYLF